MPARHSGLRRGAYCEGALLELLVCRARRSHRRASLLDELRRPPPLSEIGELPPALVLRHRPRVVRRPRAFGDRVVEDQSRDALRVCRREEHAHRRGLERPEECSRAQTRWRRAPHARRPCASRVTASHARGPRGPSPPVELDEASRTARCARSRDHLGAIRLGFEIAREAVDEEEVAFPFADHPVRDADVTAAGVPDVERSGRHTLQLWRRRPPNGSCSSPASGSRPATGSTSARRTRARSSAASRRPAPTRRGARSTPPRARSRSRCPAHKRAEILVKVAGGARPPARGGRAARSPTRPASR